MTAYEFAKKRKNLGLTQDELAQILKEKTGVGSRRLIQMIEHQQVEIKPYMVQAMQSL